MKQRLYIFFFIFLIPVVSSFSQPLSLVNPKNNFVTDTTHILFEWNRTDEAISYDLEIASDSLFTSIISSHTGIINTFLNDSLLINQIVWWHVKAFDGTSFSQWSAANKLCIINPTVFSGLNVWYSSDTGVVLHGDTVASWQDLSGNNNHANQTIVSNQPTIIPNILNLKPTLHFDGINDFLLTPIGILNNISTLSMFMVLKLNISANGGVFGSSMDYSNFEMSAFNSGELRIRNNNYSGTLVSNLFTIGDWAYISIVATNGNGNVWNNGLNLTSNNPLVQLPIALNIQQAIGRYAGGSYANFEIAEIIIYNHFLNTQDRILIENYLNYKYAGEPVDLGPDIIIPYDFCDTLIDAGSCFYNYLWSTGDTTSSISVNQTGYYDVIATDIFGRLSYDTIWVSYPINLLSDTTICLFDTIFWNTNLNHDYNFLWSTGSNDSLIAIYEAGDYYVQVIDSFGCSYMTDTITVTIDSFPQNATLGPDIELCSGNSLSLLTGVAETFLWSTGDTTESIIINTPGLYSVTVSDYMGCNNADTIDISIKGEAPVPGFINTITCLGDSTYFTDSSYTTDNSNIISWNWEFTDMTTSSLQNPAKLFNDTGLFAVTLTIETDSGCTNTMTEYVKVYPLPQTGFYQNGFCENSNIQFFDTSVCAIGSIAAWDWDFGNTQISVIQNPTAQFSHEGDYIITLIAYSDIGCSDTLIKTITLKNSPQASFKTSLRCSGTGISFTDLSEFDPINPIINWNWNFDDGNISQDQNPINLFDTSGFYNITQIVHSLNGCTDSVLNQIFINVSPVSDFPDSVACVKNLHFFENTSSVESGLITDYLWLINDTIFEGLNPQYFFNDTGHYSVQLIVLSDSLCSDTIEKDFYVFDLPDPEFTFSPYYGIVFHPLQFACNQAENNYSWNFGDGFTSEETDPTHAYLDSGLFNITHYSLDTNGCRDSVSKQLAVLYPNCDIITSALTYTQDNNYIKVCAEIANFGNIPVTEMELLVHLNDESQIREIWTGLLIPGAVMTYCFNGQYNVTDNFILELICVFANPTEYTDINLFNNEYCISHSDDFNLFDIYPNPAQSEIFFSVVLPEVKDIIYSVYDKNGKLIIKNEGNITVTGYNKFSIDISGFSNGSYTLQVEYSDIKKIKQFIVNR